MGARAWHHLAPWLPDPGDSLRAFQATFLAENYDVGGVLGRNLASTREALRDTEAGGDEYELADYYRAELTKLEEAASRPLPEAPADRVALLREIYGDEIGNILDVEAVSDVGGSFTCRRLGLPEIREAFGSESPSLPQVKRGLERALGAMNRGESVCFPVSADGDGAGPIGWFFAGYTVD